LKLFERQLISIEDRMLDSTLNRLQNSIKHLSNEELHLKEDLALKDQLWFANADFLEQSLAHSYIIISSKEVICEPYKDVYEKYYRYGDDVFEEEFR